MKKGHDFERGHGEVWGEVYYNIISKIKTSHFRREWWLNVNL